VPPHIDAAIQRALEKLPADRFATAAQFAEALAGTRDAGIVTRTGRIRPSKVKQWVPWTVAAAGVVAGVAGVVARPRPTPQPIHFTIPLRAGVTFDVTRSNIAVSPDGSHIVYSASPGGLFQMYARALGDDESRPISGTEASVYPFFSPDGAWIGFRSSDGLLKKVPATGGPAVTIGKAPGFGGAVWGPDDVITFSRGALAGMARIRASGGQPTEFVPRDSALRSSVQPTLLPNGDVLFTSIKGNETHLALATPDGHVTQLDQSGFNPMFVRPSYIVFGSMEGVLSVAKFDLRTHRFAGPAIGMVEGVFARPNGSVLASVSRDGNLLAYVRGSAKMRLGLVTATGETQVLPGDQRRFRHPRVSPDGTRIAVDVAALDHSIDVWVYDIRSAGLTRLTFDGRSQDPIWSPDGKRVAFSVTDQGSAGVDTYVVAADGSSKPQLLIGGGGNQWPAAFLGDGRSLVFDELLPGGRMHTSLLKADGKTEILAGSDQFTMRLPAVSPDGKWLAYTSNESGVTAVFVRALGGAGGGKWQVSLADGTQPVWSRDNKTIFYRAEGRIIAASVAASGNSFTITSRKNFADDHFSMENTINFDAHPDGKHLAVVVPMDEGAQISVVVNWMEEVKRRFAGR
jgi:serine/threonine-protein kinase